MKTNLVLLLLAAILAVPTWLTVRAERAHFTEIKDIPLLFDGFNAAAVAGIRMAKGWIEPKAGEEQQKPPRQIDELQFVRQGPKWVLANTELVGAPVRTQRVEDEILEHLGRIRRDEKAVHRAKATPEEISQFGLDAENAFLITAVDAQNRVLAELVVGKDVSGGQWEQSKVAGRYVRAKANDSVLVYETDFFSPTVEPTDWLDLQVYQADLSKAVGFSLFNDTVKEPVVFEREQPTQAEWKVTKAPPDTGPPVQGDLTELMQKVSILHAARFLAPLEPEKLKARGLELSRLGLDPPQYSVSFVLDDGERIELALGRKLEDKPEVYARSNRSRFLFTAPDWFKAYLEVDIARRLLQPPSDALRDEKKDEATDGEKKDDEKKDDEKKDDEKKDDEKKDGDEGTPDKDKQPQTGDKPGGDAKGGPPK